MTFRVSVGGVAPRLSLRDADGRPVTQESLADGRPLVLYFMRTADCAVCKRHVRQLAAQHDELERRGVRVAVVVPDGTEKAAALKARLSTPFPILSGQESAAHAAVGLGRGLFGRLQQSGTIVVDADGIVRHVTSSTVPTGALDEPRLLRDLEAIAQPA
jgi:peroxiredoxin